MTTPAITTVLSDEHPAVECEQVLETLGRLEGRVLELKTRACRGDKQAHRDLLALKDELYTALAESLVEQ